PTKGTPRASASALAAASPTRSDPTSPGPFVTAIPSMSASVTPAWRSASSMTGSISSRCRRDATSGTTPPNFWCTSICDATTLERMMRPCSTTAAAVSSQLVSMPKMSLKSADDSTGRNSLPATSLQFFPHDERVFVVVLVIPGADADSHVAQAAIQPLGDEIGLAHLQRHALHAPRRAHFFDGLHPLAADALAPVVRVHGDVGNVPLVKQDPGTDVPDHQRRAPREGPLLRRIARHQVVRLLVVEQLRQERGARPRRRKRQLLHFQHGADVPDAHGLNHDGDGLLLRAPHFRSASDSRRYAGASRMGSSRSPRARRAAPSMATAPVRSSSKPGAGRRARSPSACTMSSQYRGTPSPQNITAPFIQSPS